MKTISVTIIYFILSLLSARYRRIDLNHAFGLVAGID